jgi:transcription elongation factor GreA
VDESDTDATKVIRGPLRRASPLLRELPPSAVVALGSHIVLEDLDDSTCEEYVLVGSGEANLGDGRISSESPVGRAIRGRRKGDVVDARAPHRIRHLRITDLHA